MAHYDDDFQGYSIGASAPFGSWVLDPGANTAQIVAGGSIIPGTDRHLLMNLGAIAYKASGYLTSFSQFVALNLGSELSFAQSSMNFQNGPNGSGQTFDILRLKVEADSTISAYDGQNVFLGNSRDGLLPFHSWNFLQINVTVSDVTILGVKYIHIDLEIGVNGQSVLTVSQDTAMTVGTLTNGTAEINRFRLLAGDFGAYTLDTLQSIAAYPHAGTPNAVAFQTVVEVDELPDSANLTIMQAAVGVDELPDSADLVVYQMVIEVDLLDLPRWYIYEA